MIRNMVTTILAVRIYLYLVWNDANFVAQKTDFWHHMYTGIILMLVSVFIPQKYKTIAFGIGLGLFIDELIHLFHILGLTTASDYWSFKSVMTTIMGILIVLALGFVHQRKSVQST